MLTARIYRAKEEQMYRFMRKSVLVSAVSLAAASTAFAGTATSNLAISANVNANCTISTAPVAFGAYDPVVANATTPRDSNGSVTITCTKGATTTIGLDAGGNSTHASGTTRAMTDGASTPSYLSYEIYQDSPGGTVWSNSGAGLYTPASAPSKAPRSYTVYGRIPAGQDVPVAASYSDTVTATVNF
jgi:spore coat protein U-like protein